MVEKNWENNKGVRKMEAKEILKELKERYNLNITVKKICIFNTDIGIVIPITKKEGIAFREVEKLQNEIEFRERNINIYTNEGRQKTKEMKKAYEDNKDIVMDWQGKEYIPLEVVEFWEYRNGKIITFMGIIKEKAYLHLHKEVI